MGDITDQVCPRSLAVSFNAFIVCLVRAQSALLVAGVLVLYGCGVVGPQSISAGRGVYTETINRTSDEQTLNMLVRLRALAVRRVNGLRNPLFDPESPSPAFARFVALYDRLRRADVLDIVAYPGSKPEPGYFWDIHNYAERGTATACASSSV